MNRQGNTGPEGQTDMNTSCQTMKCHQEISKDYANRFKYSTRKEVTISKISNRMVH